MDEGEERKRKKKEEMNEMEEKGRTEVKRRGEKRERIGEVR